MVHLNSWNRVGTLTNSFIATEGITNTWRVETSEAVLVMYPYGGKQQPVDSQHLWKYLACAPVAGTTKHASTIFRTWTTGLYGVNCQEHWTQALTLKVSAQGNSQRNKALNLSNPAKYACGSKVWLQKPVSNHQQRNLPAPAPHSLLVWATEQSERNNFCNDKNKSHWALTSHFLEFSQDPRLTAYHAPRSLCRFHFSICNWQPCFLLALGG